MQNIDIKKFIELSPIMMHSILPTGEVEFVSHWWLKVLGYSRDEVVGQKSTNFLSDNTRLKAISNIKNVLRDRQVQNEEFEMITKNGKVIPVLISASPIFDAEGNIVRIVAYIANISEQKETARKSEIERLQLKMALEVSNFGVWSWDIKSGHVEWDDVTLDIYGISRDQFSETLEVWANSLHPDDKERALKQVNIFSDKRKSFNTEYKIIRYDNGEVRHLRALGNVIFDDEGVPAVLIGINFDVTKERSREQELIKSNNRLQVALKSSDFGVWDWNFSDEKIYWDEGMCKIYGLTPEESPKTVEEWRRLVTADFRSRAQKDIERAIENKSVFESEFSILRGDGSKRFIRGLGKAILNERGETVGMVGLNTDITEQKNANLALSQAQKFAALGEMAGEVAHEINNPLTIIDGYVDKAKRELSKPEINRQILIGDLGKVSETIKRIANIVSGMKKYVRDASLDEARPYKVKSIVNEVTHLMSEKFKSSGIDISVLSEAECELKCRPVEISQALMNLLNNSFDAIKDLPEKWVKIECVKDKGKLTLAVIDSGKGVPVEIRDKILNRFYTTKKYGEGSGMGLNITKGIVESYGGKFELDENSKNTRFKMTFPQ